MTRAFIRECSLMFKGRHFDQCDFPLNRKNRNYDIKALRGHLI